MAFGFGIADALGHPEVSQYIDPRRNMLLGLAAGLVGGPNWSQGLSSGFQMAAQGGAVDRAAAEKARADELAAKQTAAARTWFEKNAPQYTPLLDAGMSTGDAWNRYFAEKNQKTVNPYLERQQLAQQYGLQGNALTEYVLTGDLPEQSGMRPENFDDISGLRKEVFGLPSTKNLSQAAPIYKSMVETAGRNNRASDLNLVYGLGKIMDPGSVVREGEMFMVQGVNTLPSRVVEGINSVLTGQSALTPETRKAILDEAYSRIKAYEGAFGTDADMYRQIAKRYQLNDADIIPNFGQFSAWNPAGGNPNDPLNIRGGM